MTNLQNIIKKRIRTILINWVPSPDQMIQMNIKVVLFQINQKMSQNIFLSPMNHLNMWALNRKRK